MKFDLTNDEKLEALRDLADANSRDARQNPQTFDEFRKGRGASSVMPTGFQGVGDGVGTLSGHLNTNSRSSQFTVPSGNYPSPPNPSRAAIPFSESRYSTERLNQPPNWITDVDMANTWYSPFQPVWPYGPPNQTVPREWNFPVGYNLNYIPERLNTYGMLRGMRQSWGVLATIIETRKDQLLRLPWTIQRKDKPRGASVAVTEMRKFMRKPDGKLSYSQWAHKLLDDLFVIDAPCIYMDRFAAGGLRGAEVIDGGTIFPLIDDTGRRPTSDVLYDAHGVQYITRQPAFQQIIYGLPFLNFSEDELIYAMMRPQPQIPVFGYSPVEQIMNEAMEAIRKTFYQLDFWRSGSMPELVVTVPEGWSPKNIAAFQAHFDALLSGNLTLKSKVRFLPGGMKPFDIKNADGNSLWSQRDEMLIRLACYAFSVSPTPFIQQNNRATAATAAESAQEEGLYPLMSWWKDDIMDRLIEAAGFDDIEFVFLPRPEVDLLKQAQIHQIKINVGEMTIDEARIENGEEPYGPGIGDVPLILAGGVPTRLDQVVRGIVPGQDQEVDPNSNSAKPGSIQSKPNSLQSKPNSAPQKGPAKPARASVLPDVEPASQDKQDKPTEVHKRNKVKVAESQAEWNPTSKQKKIGNYKKGHLWLHGLNITIENPKGSKRGEKDKFGQSWQVKMPAAYGYIRGTMGADDMQMDVYLGRNPDSTLVFVIDQDKFDEDGKDKGFDEHKVMLGYNSLGKALKDYLKSHFDGMGHDRLSAVTVVSLKDFKAWLKSGNYKRPISEQGVGEVIARRGKGLGISKGALIIKSDTISSSSGLTSYGQAMPGPDRFTLPRKKRKLKSGARWRQI